MDMSPQGHVRWVRGCRDDGLAVHYSYHPCLCIEPEHCGTKVLRIGCGLGCVCWHSHYDLYRAAIRLRLMDSVGCSCQVPISWVNTGSVNIGGLICCKTDVIYIDQLAIDFGLNVMVLLGSSFLPCFLHPQLLGDAGHILIGHGCGCVLELWE